MTIVSTPMQAANVSTGFMGGVPFNPMAQQQQMQPQFGLAGAEQAALQGMRGGTSALQTGLGQALSTLGRGGTAANQMLAQGAQALGGNFGASASTVDPLTGQSLFRDAAQGVGQFTPAGLEAQQVQAALSGARGQEAFNQALIDSPVQQFLREQGERSIINQRSATGGLGGGEVLRELTQFGQGLAGTQLQNQINNLANLSGQGLQAAGQRGQFLSQAGQQQGNLASQNAQLQTQAALQSAANRLGAAQGRANLFGQGASIAQALAGTGANLQANTGQGIANLVSGTGAGIGNLRAQAGRDIANQISDSTSALADLTNKEGAGLGDIIGAGGVNLANVLQNAGLTDAEQQQAIMNMLANMAVGEGSQLADLATQQGWASALADLGVGQALSGGLQNSLRLGSMALGGI